MKPPMSLDSIRIVLVRPTHPGNIGATARAMKTMSLARLYIVVPECQLGPQSTAMAAGADEVLANAVMCATLDDALADCHVVIGTSSRDRRIDWPALDPPQAARQLVDAARHGPVALLFGQERTGLTNDELDRCGMFVKIPTNEEFSSLNVAASVQILAYELLRASQQRATSTARSGKLANRGEMIGFYRHLEQVLIETEFLDPAKPRLLMRRLIRLFNRACPDDREINILRGILTSVQTRRRLDRKSAE